MMGSLADGERAIMAPLPATAGSAAVQLPLCGQPAQFIAAPCQHLAAPGCVAAPPPTSACACTVDRRVERAEMLMP